MPSAREPFSPNRLASGTGFLTTSELLALGLAEFRRLDQPKVETEALRHVTQALEVAIAWVVDGGDSSRKRILGHNRGEPELLVESLLRDTGGQG